MRQHDLAVIEMSRVLPPPKRFDLSVDVLVIGAGACGLTAALRLADAGTQALVLDQDKRPAGSTALSSGFIPAAATKAQAAQGIVDSVDAFTADIAKKSHGLGDPRLTRLAARTIGPTLDWLADYHGLEWQVLDDFLYPGHCVHRMHTVPERTGEGLMARLTASVDQTGVPIVTNAHVTALYAQDELILGAEVTRADGKVERIGCKALILACSGYGGNPDLVARHIPEMAKAPYFGHRGNRGDALIWGQQLGAAVQHLSGCQGHGSLAHPHGILITWALMTEGGIQVNNQGQRFSNEHGGYSEQATNVLVQSGGMAWDIFDGRLLNLARGFPDFVLAETAGAVRNGADAKTLAVTIGADPAVLEQTLEACEHYHDGASLDPFGRDFTQKPRLQPPYYAVRVTGALFHTQGGLLIDDGGRVLRTSGLPIPNLFAGGGAACGVSGPQLDGYLSGNGLLTAVAFGSLSGATAALMALHPPIHDS